MDQGSTSVCFSLPTYQKCVSWTADAPLDLETFVTRVLANAAGRKGQQQQKR